MSDIELAISRTKTLEALLEQALGADGRGLHEKVSSVETRLPHDLVKRLRYIATVRNKIVHEADYQAIDDRAAFLRACDDAEVQLRAMLPTRSGPPPLLRRVIIIAILFAIIFALWYFAK